MNAQSRFAFLGISAGGQYGDGMNLYQYLRSNPLRGNDPSGLFALPVDLMQRYMEALQDPYEDTYLDPLDIAFNFAMDYHSEKLAGFGTFGDYLGAGLDIAKNMALMAASIVPGLGLAIDVYEVHMLTQGDRDWNFWDYTTTIAAGLGGAAAMFKLVKAIGRYTKRGRAFQKGTQLGNILGGICFTAGTLVCMADGTYKPIEEVNVGDQVLSVSLKDGYDVVAARVVDTHRRVAHKTINLILQDGQEIRVTPGHPFYVQGQGWCAAASLSRDDVLWAYHGEGLQAVASTEKEEAIEVYNLEVEPQHNYLITTNRILVHNGCAVPHIKGNRPINDSVSYIYNTRTGEFILGKSRHQIHMDIYLKNAQHSPMGDFVGGFVRFDGNGKFVDADLCSGTFPGTQAMINDALDAFRFLKGN